MSEYQALYRAWRPEQFRDIYGQEPITRTLRHQVTSGRIVHAYLFCGSRGTGKTTTAKVFSRALNCLNPQDGEPCGACEVCRQLKNESSLDVLEIDAASNNGVDEVRALRDRIAYPPTVGRYKIYIIDEVHMLSNSAFNALLKTLEEPPAHAVFILATTEPQRLPATVLSRCQRYDFKRISVRDIVSRLEVVLSGIGRQCTPDALEEIAVSADGGMRDALSLMDMCLSYTEGEVDTPLVRQVLGSNGREFMFAFVDALAAKDAAKALGMISEAMLDGRDAAVFAREVAAHMRTLLIAQETGNDVATLAQLTTETAKRFLEQASRYESRRLMRAMDLFIKAEGDMRYVAMPRSVLEMCAVKAARISNEKTDEGLIERIEALEKQLKEGVVHSPAAQSAAAPAPAAAPGKTERPRQRPAAPVSPVYDDFKALFDQALASVCAKLPQIRLHLSKLNYIKTEGNTVFSFLNGEPTEKSLIELHTQDIEQEFSQVFGRPVKLNISVNQTGVQRDSGIGPATMTGVLDVFPRENIEISD